jgi:hypothetical protein
MDIVANPFWIPIAGMFMICAIVAIRAKEKNNAKEIESRHELRIREIEHEQKMKTMDLELAKLQAEKTKSGQ